MTDTKNAAAVWAVVQDGRAASKVGHKYEDCSTVRGEKLEALNAREAGLLGLRECSVCVKRASGGPAITALKEILNNEQTMSVLEPGDQAWAIIEQLNKRGFYIAQRTKKDGASSPS